MWRRLLARFAKPPPDPVAEETWRELCAPLPWMDGFSDEQTLRLRGLAARFLASKRFEGAHDLEIDDWIRLYVASQAALMLLARDDDWLDDWKTVIVYPGEFRPPFTIQDEAGVVHPMDWRAGEAWVRGAVILSWERIEEEIDGDTDYPANVVIHEIAHQLDGQNGAMDGQPLLPTPLSPQAWAKDFTRAFKRFDKAERGGRRTWLDPYAAEGPQEFFAVACETFFVAPAFLRTRYPEVYRHLVAYFAQDPEKRIGDGGWRY